MTAAGAVAFEHLLRDLAPQVLGAVMRRYGALDAAEDAVQEALIAAALQWPAQGVPQNPRGWLYQVAVRRLADHLRSERARRRREETVAREALASEPALPAEQDDTLALLFMCCHPALTPASAITLTLRAVAGLSTGDIARAFFVPEATMAQRISRAKQRIVASQVPFRPPDGGERAARLRAVLHVLYLLFSEGYASGAGVSLQRLDLASEAIRLTRAAHALLGDEPEVAGLLALMLLTDARRHARTGPRGELVPLDEQDRARWDRAMIAEGTALLTSALTRGAAGPYQVQAAIAALHDEAARVEETDWPQIMALYGLLRRMQDSPMVALSHAVAVAMVHGPDAGLRLVEALDDSGRLKGHYRVDAVRAHLLERAGQLDAALACYRAAAGRTSSLPERDYLRAKAARLASDLRKRPASRAE